MNHWTIIFVIFTLLKTTIASADKIDAFSTPSYYSTIYELKDYSLPFRVLERNSREDK